MRKVIFLTIIFICCIFLTGAEEPKASYYRNTYDTYTINSVEELEGLIVKLSKEESNVGEKYKEFDDAYFKDNSLIVIVLTNGLPYVKYTIENVNVTDDFAEFDVFNYLPEFVACQVKQIDMYLKVDFKIPEGYELKMNEKDLK